MRQRVTIMPGERFGGWTVIKEVSPNRWGQTMMLCKCKCGKKCKVGSSVLRRGESSKCVECRRVWIRNNARRLYNFRIESCDD